MSNIGRFPQLWKNIHRFLLGMILAGCGVLVGCGSSANLTRYYIPKTIYAITDRPQAYEYLPGGEVGEETERLPFLFADSTVAMGLEGVILDNATDYYLILHPTTKDSIYVSEKEMVEEREFRIHCQPTTFTVTKDEDVLAWGRALQYVTERSKAKIRLQTENIIQTYPPDQRHDLSYTITRIPIENNRVQYNVKVMWGGSNPDIYIRGAKACAVYIVFGM